MKTALIFFRDSNKIFNAEYYALISSCFENAGVDISQMEILSPSDDILFKRRFTEYKDTCDNLIIFDSEDLRFDLKAIVAEIMDTPMVENDLARQFLDAVMKEQGKTYTDAYAQMPIEATVVPNLRGAEQGFILDDKNFTLALLPMAVNQVKPMCEKYVLPYIEKKSGVKKKRFVLKYFGDKTLLENTFEGAKSLFDGKFMGSISEQNGDFTIDMSFAETSYSNDVIRYIISELKDNIYAEFDTSLGERLFDLLKLRGLKLSTAESFTGGRIMSSIISNAGASLCVNEGVVSYSNESKEQRLGVKREDLAREGAVSSIVAYQMCAGLIKGGNCDIAIATTGIAGPKSDNTAKPVGLCYIAVGMKDGVHTYKYVFKGDREEITETAKNTALFLAIKILKNI